MAGQPVSLPPGPRWPGLVQGLQWIYRPIPFMEACARRYGDWFTVRLPRGMTFVFTSEPEAVRQIFAGDPDAFHAGPVNVIVKPLLGAHSLLLLDGKAHRAERRLMMPPFHGERMQAYGEAMRGIIGGAMARFPRGRPFPIHPEMQAVTLDVILRTVFGAAGETPLKGLLKALLDVSADPAALMFASPDGTVPWLRLQLALGRLSPWGRVAAIQRRVDDALFAEIARRRRGPAGDDILSLLLASRYEDGRPMTDQDLRDELLTLLVAGHETTATALSWAVSRLVRHPEAAARLGEPDYLDAFIKETLRLHPIVPLVGRYLTKPAAIAGRELPAGASVTPCIYLTHRRPDIWPDPERFDPERFLDTRVPPQHFYPFGGGARRCLGMAFALYEMKVILGEMVGSLKFQPSPGYAPRVARRGITFAPSEGMPVIAN